MVMEILVFMGIHPIITVILTYIICATIVDVVKLCRKKLVICDKCQNYKEKEDGFVNKN